MPRPLTTALCCCIAIAIGLSPARAAALPDASPADVTARAMMVLRDNCTSCHNPEKKKGGLLLTSRAEALKGGEDGPAIVVGEPTRSPLLEALLPDADPHMPPKGQLAKGDIDALRTWIAAGAAWDEHLLAKRPASTRPVALRPLPPSYHPVLAMALSPDQKRLAVARGDHLLLFDLSQKSRPVVAERATPNDLIQSLAWSHDGRHLAAGGYGRVRVWDVNSSQSAQEFTDISGRVTSLCFTPDDAELMAGEGEGAQPGRIRSWRIKDGKEAGGWEAHGDAVLAMEVSRDGKLLVSGGADKQVKLWELPARREMVKLEGHTAQVMAVALSPDATRVASAGADKEIKVWDVKTHELLASLLTNPAGVTDLHWVDDKVLLSTCEDGTARLSNVVNKDRAEKQFTGAPDVLYCCAVTKDGTIFAGCHDGNVYLWSLVTGKLEGTLPAPDAK